MSRIPTVFLGLVMLAILAPPARTCECLPPPSPKKALEGADAVFSGRIIESRVTPVDLHGHTVQGVVAIFAVDRVWKGPQERRIAVATGRGHGDCGFSFTTGEEYIVYAHWQDKGVGKELQTNICARTKPLFSANEDIGELGKPTAEFGKGLKLDSSGQPDANLAYGSGSYFFLMIAAAASIGLIAGLGFGLALGRRRARRLPAQEPAPSSMDVTAPHPISTDITDRPPSHLKRGS